VRDPLEFDTETKHMAKSGKSDDSKEDFKIICRNKRASFDYELIDRLECGIALCGTEVKSLRDGIASLEDSYAKIEGHEVWLIGAEIPEYAMGNRLNHKPKRPRKLLLHRREIASFAAKATQKGFTLVPVRMYFKGGLAKVEIAVARGKQAHDKRETQKQRDADKAIRQAMMRRR
jgi:SsrA-binding protein